MKLIVVSEPEFIQGEHEAVHALFEAGLELFHLRKPDATEQQLDEYLKKIKPAFMRRIVLHQHYPLINRFNLKGIHLKEVQYKQTPEAELKKLASGLKKKGLNLSCALHSTGDIPKSGFKPAYFFLSPVFESISKPGYGAGQDLLHLPDSDHRIIALGGINNETIHMLSGKGFAGAALLGAIWEPFKQQRNCNEIVQIIKRIRETGNSLIWKTDPAY